MAQRLSQAWAGVFGEHRPDSEYYGGLVAIDVTQTVAISQDYLHAIPIMIGKERTVDRIAIRVTVVALTKSAYLGIYEDDGDLYPSSLAVDGATVSIHAVDNVEVTISKVLTPGFYWLVILPEADCTIKAHFYTLPLLGVGGATFDTYYKWWKVSQAYGALPSDFPGGASKQSGFTPSVLARFSA